jgi:hypothetical protein
LLTKLLYASRGNHSILRVLLYPPPCVQADKSTAGLKATGQAHIAGTLYERLPFIRIRNYIGGKNNGKNISRKDY